MVAAERYQDDEECARCPIASGCAQCQGFSYDEAETPTNFQRAKYICKMEKARVSANEYFFAKLYNRFGINRETVRETSKIYFLLSDNFATFCCYDNNDRHKSDRSMSLEMIERGLKYCRENFLSPIFVHGDERFLDIDFPRVFEEYHIQHIIPIYLKAQAVFLRDILVVIDHSTVNQCREHLPNCVYNIDQSELRFMADDVILLFDHVDRVNVNILNLSCEFDEIGYYEQLVRIKDYLVKISKDVGLCKEINILTDLCLIRDWNNCKAGERTFTYAPNGEFYACPAFYFDVEQNSIGSPEEGMSRLKNPRLYRREYHPICQMCDAKQCRMCIHRNKKATKEINVPPSFQCRKSHIERKVAVELKKNLYFPDEKADIVLNDVDYLDPIMRVPALKERDLGYYKCQI